MAQVSDITSAAGTIMTPRPASAHRKSSCVPLDINRRVYTQQKFDDEFVYVPPSPFSWSRIARHMAKRAIHCNVERLSGFLPILEWLPRYEWRDSLMADVTSGLTVGVMRIPQSMAYAPLAAMPAVYGLYTSLWPCISYPIFGECVSDTHLSIARHFVARQHWHLRGSVIDGRAKCEPSTSTPIRT